MVLASLLRALPQILLPEVRGVLWRTLALTLLIFVLLGAAGWAGLRALFAHVGWLDGNSLASAALAALIAVLAGWLLFRAVAVAIVGLYADQIVKGVEKASYPQRLEAAGPISAAAGIRVSIRSAARAIGWNIAALPIYLLLLATGVGVPILFILLNSHLLGRDLADLVEGRHPQLSPFTRWERWQLGFVSALLFVPPIVNLLAPVLSVAMATHMFHARRQD